ncbi:OB-fold putative lipoprotein [Enterobacteriaceae bacterium H20N1]|uniref:OB-fold putative lipoprotein n=1 Tax=Dryocola boscaweniae TaxID=2925397 RepID=A0A9X2W577_9ENTR|nr:hypothetical protein [Dryocola boscaweniae]MCT4701171.1 OB-fold putative lipoprotein [Dryocola boscaweniae]MCT4718324.1 OB-fold putative lipoprotein [Dryocola boscaweniae]
MGFNNKNIGYVKAIKAVGIFAVLFIVMGWVLAKTEENDKQIKARLATETHAHISPPPVIEDRRPKVETYTYTPQKLYREFNTNEVRITHKLKGNTLELRGEVGGIRLSLGNPVIEIVIPDSDSTIQVFFDSEKAGRISNVDVGDYVTVTSNDVSLNPFGSIHLRDASLLSRVKHSGK